LCRECPDHGTLAGPNVATNEDVVTIKVQIIWSELGHRKMFVPDQADAPLIAKVFMMGVMMNDDTNIKCLQAYITSKGQSYPWLAPYVALLWTCAAEQVYAAKHNCLFI
jgi:hypothetical protein